MIFQILIPQYKETEAVIKPLLDSISNQRHVDFSSFSVLIANDGSNTKLSKEFLYSYPFKIEYFLCEHKGVSFVRNFLLVKSAADYIMYCDADDMFSSNLAFEAIYEQIEHGFDALVSDFMEETPRTDGKIGFKYTKHENDMTFVHGKVYRRQFLIYNRIKWNDLLTQNEDCFFNAIALCLSKSTAICKFPFYLWCWNNNSVTRSKPVWYLQEYGSQLKSIKEIYLEFNRRKMFEQANAFILVSMLKDYFALKGIYTKIKNLIPLLTDCENKAKAFYSEFSQPIGKYLSNEEYFNKIVSVCAEEAKKKGCYAENEISAKEWISSIIS